jgi:hypothetical protein
LSQVRDLFFDEFYDELEKVIKGIETTQEEPGTPPVLADEVERHWNPYQPDPDNREGVLISVDGGVQISNFAYGGLVTVARACALTHHPGQGRNLTKKVKIHIQETHDNRDRAFIPGYARTIAEYTAATQAAQHALDQNLKPTVLLDGSLYLARFPYAIREYRHHPTLIQEFFTSITELRTLAHQHSFPVAAVAKDSTVFYLHMQLLRKAISRAGYHMLLAHLKDATTPLDLSIKVDALNPQDRKTLETYVDPRPLCDTHLVHACTTTEGHTTPLLLAPSIYYARGDAPALYTRIRRNIPEPTAGNTIASIEAFFSLPGVATTYWRPQPSARPFRIDLTAHTLGHPEPWGRKKGNTLLELGWDSKPLRGVLDHLGHWYCNDVEYNIPLKQADILARFDRNLYKRKYEPYIIRRLEQAGVDIAGTRRNLREMES